MKRREDQILEIISDNPLISQKEIADILDITRSSVGVHINNLTKKGKIIGRGYVLSKVDKVSVIGGANFDIYGKPDKNLEENSTNQGYIEQVIGGSGRNVAEMLVKLGIETELITAIGNDEHGKIIADHCIKSGIRLDKSSIYENQKTSNYISLLDANKEIRYAVADMTIMNKITPAVISKKKMDINHSELIILDGNLPESTIDFILTNFKKKKILVDPTSFEKAEKFVNNLKNIYMLKLNKKELSVICSQNLETYEQIKDCADHILDKGIKHLVVSDGPNGVYYFTKGKDMKFDAPDVEVVSILGAGDGLMAGIVYGIYHDLDIEEAIKAGLETSAINLESKDVISPWINVNNLNERLSKHE